MAIDANKLSYALPIIPTLVLDNIYSCPTEEWVEKEFSAAYAKTLQGMSEYRPEVFDCDEIALMAMSLARLYHRRLSPDSKTALAFGVIFYTRDNGGHHAANCFMVKTKYGEYEMRVYEPQMFCLIQLTKTEYESINDIII